MVSGIADPDRTVRLSAIRLLGEIGDARDLPLLKQIAQGDSDQVVSGGRTTYPLRVAAQRASAQIRAR